MANPSTFPLPSRGSSHGPVFIYSSENFLISNLSSQLIFFILHIHISKASNLFLSASMRFEQNINDWPIWFFKKMKKISHRHRSVAWELIPLFGPWSRRGLNPIKPVYDPDRPDGRLNLTASAFNWLKKDAHNYTACLFYIHYSN